MENNENQMMARLEEATSMLERAVALLEGHQQAGEVQRIAATVDTSATGKREAELAEKLAQAECEIAALRASAAQPTNNPLRKTLPAGTSDMLAKHGIGEGPVDVRTLDTALAGLSLEQRIAVKTQLLRAGAIA